MKTNKAKATDSTFRKKILAAVDIPRNIQNCEYLRLPRPCTRCPVTSLSRAALHDVAILAGAKFSLRLPGNKKGTVLIDKARLLAYLTKMSENPTA